MVKAGTNDIYRIIDANLNRSKEGLRVCEDITRFVLNDTAATRAIKSLRHRIIASMPHLKYNKLIESRDVGGDVGKKSGKSELDRRDLADIFYANAQRAKESIRVLEEISKLINGSSSDKLKRIRYEFYSVEKRIAQRI